MITLPFGNVLIGIENHASASVTNCANDFINTPKSGILQVRGIKRSLPISRVLNSEMDDSG
jgi:hypothetical protein